jgi:dUTP pyrophosphatase
MNIEVMNTNSLMGNEIPLPKYATDGAAGIDLRACISQPITLQHNETQLIGSGIAINIHQKDVAAVLLPRSGLGAKHGIVLGNLVGLIDSDYRKEIKIAVWNRSDKAFIIKPGERLCQMVFVPIIQVDFKWVTEIEGNGRGGFGSTGLN